MTVMTFQRPTVEPLHPPEWDRPATMPGLDDFRVTQSFDTPDFYWKDIDPVKAALGHRATDIGNGRCGYQIVAMREGMVALLRDNATALGAPTDALGVRIDHGFGVTSEYWHLNSWSVAHGSLVSGGQEIGKVGKTGLGQVCHCHIEFKINGVRIDPEPLMFGGTLTVGEDEDDMKIPTGTRQIAQGVMDKGSGLYEAPSLTAKAITLDSQQFVAVYATASGDEFRGSKDWLLVGWGGDFHFAHALLVRNTVLTPSGAKVISLPAPAPADCSQPVADATANERLRWEQWLGTRP